MKKIVCIGGGTGPTAFLSGLVAAGGREKFDISAVVSVADSGGSSGRLRDEKGVLPPGDVLKALLALSPQPYAREILQKRFADNGVPKLNGHSAGNLLIWAICDYVGDYLAGVHAIEQMLECQGRVFPVTLTDTTLVATTSKREIEGEGRIEEWIYDRRLGMPDEYLKSVRLVAKKDILLLAEAEEVIRTADAVVIGPGSFFTSLMAVLSVDGMTAALKDTKGTLVYVVNLTTNPRETPRWKASTFIGKLEKQIKRRIDVAVINSHLPVSVEEKYEEKKSDPVRVDVEDSKWQGRRIILGEFVRPDSKLARHDPEFLTNAILSLI